MSILRAQYTVCDTWLRKSGLAIKPDKMEAMFFQKLGMCNQVPTPTQILIPD